MRRALRQRESRCRVSRLSLSYRRHPAGLLVRLRHPLRHYDPQTGRVTNVTYRHAALVLALVFFGAAAVTMAIHFALAAVVALLTEVPCLK